MWRAWRVLKDVQKRTFSEASQGFSVYPRGVAFGVLSPCFASLICSRAPKELQGQVFGLAIVVTWHLVPTPYAHRGAFFWGSVWWDLCTSCLWSLKSPAWFTRQFKMSDFKHEEMIGKYSKCVNQIQESKNKDPRKCQHIHFHTAFFLRGGNFVGNATGTALEPGAKYPVPTVRAERDFSSNACVNICIHRSNEKKEKQDTEKSHSKNKHWNLGACDIVCNRHVIIETWLK